MYNLPFYFIINVDDDDDDDEIKGLYIRNKSIIFTNKKNINKKCNILIYIIG